LVFWKLNYIAGNLTTHTKREDMIKLKDGRWSNVPVFDNAHEATARAFEKSKADVTGEAVYGVFKIGRSGFIATLGEPLEYLEHLGSFQDGVPFVS
jgi:hypothetical protein